jgi:multiple sugar transport system permease protein
MKTRILQIGIWLILIVSAAFTIFPFILMAATSLKASQEIISTSLNIFPRKPILLNYLKVFGETLVVRYMLNGFIVVTLILASQLLINLPAAYAFAKREFPFKKLLFACILAALVFPRYIAAIPNFLILSRFRLIDTYSALIVPMIASPFCIFLLRQYILTIPEDYFDAAKIEGCSIFRTIFEILVPMIRPAIGSFAIFSIVIHWNDFFWPLIVIQSREMFTPPAGIVFFADAEGASDWGAIMAASMLTVAPLIVLFLSLTKQFIASLTHTGLKG